MKILLDTNAYSALMRGDESVAARVRRAERIFCSAVVVGELMFGFRSGTRYETNLRILEAFLDSPYVEFIPVTLSTADRFSRIAVALKQKGSPIPTNDIWIAAQAMETGADLVSYDNHFGAVDGLAWVVP